VHKLRRGLRCRSQQPLPNGASSFPAPAGAFISTASTPTSLHLDKLLHPNASCFDHLHNLQPLALSGVDVATHPGPASTSTATEALVSSGLDDFDLPPTHPSAKRPENPGEPSTTIYSLSGRLRHPFLRLRHLGSRERFPSAPHALNDEAREGTKRNRRLSSLAPVPQCSFLLTVTQNEVPSRRLSIPNFVH